MTKAPFDGFSPGVTPAIIEKTYEVIRPHIRKTPVIEVSTKDFGTNFPDAGSLWFKLEFMQHGGSFKARGAMNSVLTRKGAQAGVVAASGGNHGVAVAYAAKQAGVAADIFVPAISSPAKIEKIKSFGANLHVSGDLYADALAASERFLKTSDAISIHAYDQDETLAGQGTVALEFSQQCSVDTMLVATGGGGLIGGMAAYLQGRTKLVSVEPEAAPTLHAALAAGKPVDAPGGGVAADSLAPKQVGQKMFPFAAAYVAQAVLVTDDAIIDAQKQLWDKLRVVLEPGGAAAFAALASGAYRPEPDECVGVLLCGANSHAVNFD